MRFRLDGRGGRIVRRSLTAGFDPDQPRDDHGRWSATVEHAYNGESEHSFESHREEIPSELNKIISRAEGGPAMVNHATVEDDKGNPVYRYSGRNGGEFLNPDGSPVTASAEENVDEPETAAERWDRLAREIEEEIEPEPIVASGGGSAGSLTMLRLAAEEIDAARQREHEVFAAKSREDRSLMREVLSALHTFAGKPAGDTHITMPATELHPHVTIHEPDITVEPASPPDVSVNVEPAQVTVEAAPTPNVEVRPEITVQPPNVEVQPPEVSLAAPEIHVTVEQPQRPSSVRAIKNDDGSTVFTVEPDDDEE